MNIFEVNKIFPNFFRKLSIFICLGIVVNLSFCGNTNKADYQDDYNNRLIFSILMTPTPDPKAKCIAMMTEAANCLPSATDKATNISTLTTTLTSLGVPFASVVASDIGSDNIKYTTILYSGSLTILDYSTYCDTAVNSILFKDASEGFKDCVFQCQKDNYTNNINLNQCTQKVTQNLITDSLGIGQNLCIIKCSKVTNN
jgi:hypothetical protein